MKKQILAVAVIAVLSSAMLTGCNDDDVVTGVVSSMNRPLLDQVTASMAAFKEESQKIGDASIGNGLIKVGGKDVPNLMLGSVSQNNNFDLVDRVTAKQGGTATLFVKSGNEFVRVATNVKKNDDTRAVGTILDPKGKAFAAINEGHSYKGDVDILGKTYTALYEPIKSASNEIIGVRYVGYLGSS